MFKVKRKLDNEIFSMQVVRRESFVISSKTLQIFNHPFIQNLHCVFQNKELTLVYFLYDYHPVSLLSILQQHKRIDTMTAKIWAAELFLALNYLNQYNVVVR